MKIENSVVLVTGASSGLGAQFARTLAKSGCGVVLALVSYVALHPVAGQPLTASAQPGQVGAADALVDWFLEHVAGAPAPAAR